MSIIQGKKYVVISPEEYERLTMKSYNLKQPEHYDMKKSEFEMKNIWNKDQLSIDEKVRMFTEELNNFKSRYNEVTKREPLEVFTKNSRVKEEIVTPQKTDLIEEGVAYSLPKTSKKHGKMLIDYLKLYPNIIRWNDKGEIIYQGQLVKGTNITDLILDVMSVRSKKHLPTFHEATFTKALADINVPNDWIKNGKRLDEIRLYKYEEERKVTPKKQKMELISS